MGQPLEVQIRKLQDHYWSDADPWGRGFVPLADAYRRVGNDLEALRLLREGLERHPDFASGYVVKGWVHHGLGEIEEAGRCFRSALEADAGNVAALLGIGEIHQVLGEEPEAAEVFRRVLRLDPTRTELEPRVIELESRALAAPSSEVGEGEETRSAIGDDRARPWEDPEEVARELDLEDAVLQPDLTSGRGAEAPPIALPPAALPDELAEEDRAALKLGGGAVGDLWVAEDGRLPPVGEGVLVTRTLGEIYLRQGFLDQAEAVFEELLGRDPANRELQELLARARSPGTEPVVPFAGDSEVSPEDAAPAPAEDETALASAAVLPIETLAPDRVVPIEALAPDLIVPIEALAPDLIVSIESLAPDLILPIETLAPDVIVPVAELASVEDGGGDEPGMDGEDEPDPVLDAFQDWLDHLP